MKTPPGRRSGAGALEKVKLLGTGAVEGKVLLGIIDPGNKVVESNEADSQLALGPFQP